MVLASEATQAQIERILQNKNLRLSEVQRRLLIYLTEKSLAGEADDLKEYTVGIDALGKPASYDPRQESVVRMHVARLRQKLADYYRTDGIDDPILVELPKGGFKMTFEPRPAPAAHPPAAAPVIDKSADRRPTMQLLLAASLLIVMAGVLYFVARPSRAERPGPDLVSAWSPDLQQLWGPLLSAGRPLVVCIATPSFGTASGAFRLGQFLGPRKLNLLVTPSNQLSMPEIAMDNVVFLGPPTGNRQLQAIPIDQQIVLEPGGIRNLNPRPGEPVFLSEQPPREGQDIQESHALITLTPGLYGKGEILYLSGNQVSSVMAAVQAFTDPTLARTLVSKMRAASGVLPRYYQTVLDVKSMDDMPIEIRYMFHRELSASKKAASK